MQIGPNSFDQQKPPLKNTSSMALCCAPARQPLPAPIEHGVSAHENAAGNPAIST